MRLADGLPDSQAVVVINPRWGAHGAVTAQTIATDANGRYEASGLEVGEYWVFTAQRSGKADLAVLAESGKEPPVVTIAAGEVKEVDL